MNIKYFLYYATIFLAILWDPIQQFILHVDGAGRIPLMVSVIACIVSLSDWNKYSKATKCIFAFYFLLVLYEIINSLYINVGVVANFSDSKQTLISTLLKPFLVLIVSYVSFTEKPEETTSLATWSLFIFILFVFLKGQMNASYDDTDRMGVEGFSTNTIANKSALFLFFVMLNYVSNHWKPLYCVLLSIPALILVLVSGSRQSLLLVIALGVYIALTQFKGKQVFSFILFTIIALFAVSYVISSTDMGSRLLMTAEQGQNFYFNTDNTILKYFGDRGPQYIEAAMIIPEHPIFGIGMRNFSLYSYNGIVFHSEYLIHLCECGIIAFILYVLYLSKFLSRLIKTRSETISLLCLCLFVGLMILGLFTRICYHSYYFIFYGIALAVIDRLYLVVNYDNE